MRESIRICIQVLEKLNNLISDNDNSGKYSYNLSRYQLKTSMESVIIHFKNFSRGFIVPTGYCYVSTEAPKGEFGISIESTGNNLIERCKIRAPGFFHLAALPQIIR
jgi:NADH-quinone oxidoreductase subunit D